MGAQMDFPRTFAEFIDNEKFKDAECIYTNGAYLVSVLRVCQGVDHYFKNYPRKESWLNLGNFLDYLSDTQKVEVRFGNKDADVVYGEAHTLLHRLSDSCLGCLIDQFVADDNTLRVWVVEDESTDN